ncbi:AMP-binding protein [Spongiactinospora sp. 9N601]|uniref:AMP-binding protein n=1 Tax=Spongiactinospora sp. 9N601 TaxID=3375149 RepID=UPI00378ECF1D
MPLLTALDSAFARYRDHVCFTLADKSRSWTYGEIHELSHRVAAALRAQGDGPGARVAVLSANDPVAFACQLGVLRAGAAYVPLNVRSQPGELAALLTMTGCATLFYQEALAADAARVLAAAPGVRQAVSIGPELHEWMGPAGVRCPPPDAGREAPAWIMGTGGTTGAPKAVVLSHRSIATMALGLAAHMPEERPVQIAAAPLTHAAGGLTFPLLLQGGRTVVHQGVDPGAILESIERDRVTRLFLPPTAIYSLLDHPRLSAHDYSTLRYFLYGAAPMSTGRLRAALDAFGPVMAQFYGQGEAPTICTWLSPADHAEAVADPARSVRLASCGRPSLVARVAVLDEKGRPLPPGEVGELAVRTDLRMSGYLDDPEATAELDRGDGWQATGDLGRLDDDGFVYIVDRLRDLIITGGFNVFPSEVEQVLWGHPAVGDCAVIGLPDDHWGEAVTAVVELKTGESVPEHELIELCRDALGSVQAPKRVIFRDLPRSPVGKVLKKELRAQYWAGRSRSV